MSHEEDLIIGSMSLSEEYRSSRVATTVICTLCIGWTTAQVDLKVLNLGFMGDLDLAKSSIPILLTLGLVYSSFRASLDYCMQSVEVRRWAAAQLDFRILVRMVQFSILSLGAGGIHQSLSSLFYTIAYASVVLISHPVLAFILTMVLTALSSLSRGGRDRRSIANTVGSAMMWSEILVFFLLIFVILILGYSTIYQDPMRKLWSSAPAPFAVWGFVFASIVALSTLPLSRLLFNKLFAYLPEILGECSESGIQMRIYGGRSVSKWNWSSKTPAESGGESNDGTGRD